MDRIGRVWNGTASMGSDRLGLARQGYPLHGATMTERKVRDIGGDVPTNGAAATVQASQPYAVVVKVKGNADLLMHRWNPDAVDAKAVAAKGSKAKKTDDVESYVYRNDDGDLCVPGEYLRQATIHAAKFRQDPRSPRKSAMDLFKAALVVDPVLASLGTKEWDYLDVRRVVVQRSGINRSRPAMRAGWSVEFVVNVLLPEYVSREMLHETLSAAGRLIGLGDFRPTYGRFQVTGFADVET